MHWLSHGLISIFVLTRLFITANTQADSTETIDANKVMLGVYVISIHDLDFESNTFGADFWVWTDHQNSRFQPLKTMEFVNDKSIAVNLQNTQSKENQIWSQQKVQGTFRHSWDMSDFPFDHHVLSISIEEGLDNIENLHYSADIKNSGYAKDINIDGFSITNMTVKENHRDYASNFGDLNTPPYSSYSQLQINIELQRVSRVLFLKLHTALYVSFLVSAFCFPLLPQIQKIPQMVGSILSVIVGSLFASIINLRSTDAVIGRSEALTLVDRLHFVTFFYFIMLGMIAMVILITRERWNIQNLYRFSRWSGWGYIMSYIAVNFLLVWRAAY